MGLLDYDLLVIGGGGFGVGRAKMFSTCISYSAKEIFTGFVGGEVSVLPPIPRLVLLSFLFPSVRGSGKRSYKRMALVAMATKMPSEMGSLARSAFFRPSSSC